jgi:hypothetical protein
MLTRLAALGMLGLILASVISATAASVTVSPSSVGQHQSMITAKDLKPARCASLNLTAKLSGSGTFSGSGASELLLGNSGAEMVDGREGDDCIVSGAGDDSLIGGAGTDVCLGGTGNDTYDPSCEIKHDQDSSTG